MQTQRSTKFIIHLLGFGTAISLLGDATLYTVLPHPEISAQLGITLSMVGLLLGANRAVRLLINGPIGILYDRLPRRGLLVSALALGAGSSIFYAVGSGFWPLFLGRVLWGLAWSLLWVGGNSVILDISSPENRGKNSGVYQMWFIIGVASSSFLGAVLTDRFGFRTGQWISVAVIAATALIWFFFLPETRPILEKNTEDLRKSSSPKKYQLPWRVLGLTSLTIFSTRFLAWGVIAATAILWLSEIFGEGAWIGAYFIPIASLTGLYTALSNLTGILSTPLAGSISDRISRRWPVLGSAAILGGVGLWLMSGEIQIIALLGAFLVPVAGSTTETLIPAIAGDRVPENMRSRALGLINTAGDLGATIGPFAALGLIQANWLSISGIYRIGGSLLFGIALLAFSPLVSNRKQKFNQV